MNCPKCAGGMQQLVHQGVEIERCRECAGLWFDAFEHEELKELSGSERIDSAPRATKPGGGTGLCPKDRQPLFHMVVAGQPHIAIETCGFCHGVFFDAGEFSDFKEETYGERLRILFGTARAATAEKTTRESTS